MVIKLFRACLRVVLVWFEAVLGGFGVALALG